MAFAKHSDLEQCRALIRTGSYSFHAASRLLPGRVRDPALVLYAFCRCADDAVDEGGEKARAVLSLEDRLARVYAGKPLNSPVDRAFAELVAHYEMPRALPEALLEGLAWDAMGRRYASLEELHAYSARVASAVGAMMVVLMGVSRREVLARACDLGLAMQLTNIARDVGEDAHAGRVYLPTQWFEEAGLSIADFLRDPLPHTEIRAMVRRLLAEAQRLYLRADAGITALPISCQGGIFAARRAYAAIGGAVQDNGYDSISYRAYTNKWQKAGFLARSLVQVSTHLILPQSAVLYASEHPETTFLVDAACRGKGQMETSRAAAVIDILLQLRDLETAKASVG